MKIRALLPGLFVLLLIAACGQKGDLYRTVDIPPPDIESSAK